VEGGAGEGVVGGLGGLGGLGGHDERYVYLYSSLMNAVSRASDVRRVAIRIIDRVAGM